MAAERPLTYHWIRLRAVAHPTEVVERVAQAVRFVGGGGPDLVVNDTALETHHGLPQHVLEVAIDRSRNVRDLLGRLFEVPGVLDRFKAELEPRTDEDGVFYARFDKQEAYAGRLVLTSGEDCVQVRLKLEAYPAGRDAALRDLKRLFDGAAP